MSKITQQLERARKKRMAAERLASICANDLAAQLRKASDGFLASLEWKALRAKVLDAYGPQCMRCGHLPSKPWRVNVDHIKPRKTHPHLALEFENCQVLCARCNKAKGNKHEIDYRKPLAIRLSP